MTATTSLNCLAPRLHTATGAAEFAERLTAAIAARGLTLESFGENYPWDAEIPAARDAWDAEINEMLDAAEKEWTGPGATVTLLDYANARRDVVLWVVGVGCPTGQHFRLGDPDDDYADRRGLLDLTGEVEADGSWQWDGQGRPTDDRGNSIYNVQAFVRADLWESLGEDA